MSIIPLFGCLNLKFCSYEATVENGKFEASIPRRYGLAFKEGLAKIDIKKA